MKSRTKQANLLVAFCAVALLWRVVLVYVLHTPLTTLPRWTYSASDARFDSILFGCILAIRNNFCFNDPSPLLKRFKGSLAVIGLATIAASLIFREPHFRETLRYTLQSLALYPIFLLLHFRRHLAGSVAGVEALRYLGWVSYSMYLFHFIPLGIAYEHYHGNRVSSAILSFMLALLYSWAMRQFVENPVRKWRSRLRSNA